MSDSVLYAELTPTDFRRRLAAAPIAYLPLGTLEWHGEHMPLGADGLQSQGFFVKLAEEVGGIVLPMLFVGPDLRVEHEGEVLYGMDTHLDGRDRPGRLDGSAYWIDGEQFKLLLENILEQLARAGFRIVVAHGHTPSIQAFDAPRAEWEARYGLKLFSCWGSPEDADYGIQTDHGAANETSLTMALRPELVHLEYLDPDPSVIPIGIGGLEPRTHASVERGEKILALQVPRMAGILRQALGELG